LQVCQSLPLLRTYVENLPGYEGIRIHYLDEGPQDAKQVFLCLHGEPTWSYLYRKMISVFTAASHRSVALDFVGFGRSEKPVDDGVYTFTFHREMLRRFVERLDLQNITLVCQDWGGLLGMTMPMDMPGRFARLLVMNTALGTGDVPLGTGFLARRAFAAANPDLDVAKLMARACDKLSTEECGAYAAPFPDVQYKAEVRRFPQIVPDVPDAQGAGGTLAARAALVEYGVGWTSLHGRGNEGPRTGASGDEILARPDSPCPPQMELAEGGHFVQECGEKIASMALKVFR
jgi:haloalkane dehalogenase